MQPGELNYDIYDKELLVIYEAFKQWWIEGTTPENDPNSDPNPWSLSDDRTTLQFRGIVYVPDHINIWLNIL